MIPIHLVCGFLGSGKTTLLREVARRYPDRRWVFLVNEFASIGVDSVALKDCGVPVMEVVGGSLFCRCRVEHFIKELGNISDTFGDAEGLFVETTGMADPRVIGSLLKDCGMDGRYRLEQVICVVSPKRFLAVADSLPVVSAQVEAASRVVLNQLDLCSAEEIGELRRRIEILRPGVPVHEAHFCDVGVLEGVGALPSVHGELSVVSNPFTSFEVKSDEACDPRKLAARLNALGEGVYRAKGVIRTHEGFVLFDWKGGVGFSAEALDTDSLDSDPCLVVLVNDACSDDQKSEIKGVISEG